MKRAPISVYLGVILLCSLLPDALAQSAGFHRKNIQTTHADDAPMPYQVRIAPTALPPGSTSIEIGSDHWSARGYDLKTLVAQIFDVDSRLVDASGDAASDTRFDLTVDLPTEVDTETMQHILTDALQKKFHLTIAPVSRTLDVYVLSAPNGPGTALHPHPFASHAAKNVSDEAEEGPTRITYAGKQCSGVSSGGIAVSGGTVSDLRRTLEPDLDRVLLDETHLDGSYDFQIGSYASQQQLFDLMSTQLGLVIAPAQRSVTMLAVRPAASSQTLQAQL